MIDLLADPFRNGLTQRALLEVAILAVACGPLGTWILLTRRSYAAESFSHAMLPGLVLAVLAGVPLVLGALGGVLLAAGAVTLAGRGSRLGGDAAIAVVVSTLFGAGALLALSPATPAGVGELLFGDLLAVSPGDLAISTALVLAALAALAAAHRSLALWAFDAGSARTMGARAGLAELTLLGVLGITLVAAVSALGNLLVLALLIAPAAAAQRCSPRLVPAMAWAVALAILAGWIGLMASHHLGVAAGASVSLAAVAIYAAVALLRPDRGPGRGRVSGSPVQALTSRG